MPNRFVVVLYLLTVAPGCATYKATLTNAQGKTMTCEASGQHCSARHAYDDCLEAAKAQGYSQAPPPASTDKK